MARQIANSLFVSLHYALLPLVALAFGLKKRAGVLAGLLGAVFPIHFWTEIRGHESPLAALGMIMLALLTLQLSKGSTRTLRTGALLGVCWGIGVLLNPVFLPVFCGLLALQVLRNREDGATLLFRYGTVSLVAMVLPTLPWAARNLVQLDSPVWLRSNLGLELSVSNNDAAKATYFENEAGIRVGGHPYESQEEARKLQRIGEVAYNKQKLAAATQWISAHPGRFAQLTAMRFTYFWFPKMQRPVQSPLLWMMTMAAIFGLVRLYSANRETALFFMVMWLSYPVIYYFVQFAARYRYPIHWTFLLLALVAVEWSVEKPADAP